MKQVKWLWIMGVFLCSLATANASLQLSVATDKSVYHLGETVNISITVLNSGSTSEKLYGGFYFTTYIMDGVYDWADRSGPEVVVTEIILPGKSKTWTMSHGFYEMQDYPLVVGNHSVVGGAGFTLLSDPVEFHVVNPEPATISLLSFGFLLLRKKK